jgi:Methyltransferase domain
MPQDTSPCLICGGVTHATPAVIAAFLVQRCGLETDTTEICYCPLCDFAFFARRLTDGEAARLYTGYRNDDYNRERLVAEPGYEPLIPIFADPLSAYYMDRMREYNDVMSVFPMVRPFSVLDLGGDGSIPKRLFPYATVSFDDLSAGTSQTAEKTYDLIFASQVLEHVPDPVGFLRAAASRLSSDGYMFVDVPKEYEGSLSEGLLWQARYGGALITMHEHINHFSNRALRIALQAAELQPFFEIEPVRHRTFLTLAARPGSPTVTRLKAEEMSRTLLWGQAASRHLATRG